MALQHLQQRCAGIASTSYSIPYAQRCRPLRAASAPAASVVSHNAEAAKKALLACIEYTRRGSNTTKELRGRIEEAQVAVEACSGPELDYSLLEGKWQLLYTTAPDVVCTSPTTRHTPVPTAEPKCMALAQRLSSPQDVWPAGCTQGRRPSAWCGTLRWV